MEAYRDRKEKKKKKENRKKKEYYIKRIFLNRTSSLMIQFAVITISYQFVSLVQLEVLIQPCVHVLP